MSSVLVELAQQDGITLGNGDYRVSIPPGVKIEEGDVVTLNKAFIDNAAASSQKFNITSPLTLDIGVGYYQQLVRTGYQDNSDGGTTGYAADPYFDCKTYVLCQEEAGAGFVLPGIQVQGDALGYYTKPSPGDSGSARYVQIACTIQYTAPSGEVKQTTVDLSKYVWTSNDDSETWTSGEIDAIVFDKTKPVTFQNFTILSMEDGPPNNQKNQYYDNNTTAILDFRNANGIEYKSNWKFSPNPSGATTPSVATTQPLTRKTSANGHNIVVPVGTYTPQDMAALINDQLQKDYASGGNLLNSTFLIKYNLTDYPNTIWVAEDRSAAIRTAANLAAINDGLLIGATQMALAYDEDRQTFFWQYIHSPYNFGGPPATESVGFLTTVGLTAGQTNQSVIRNSGVFFTELSATDANGDQVAFWDKYLGFDLTTLIAANGAATTGNIRAWDPGNLFLPSSLETGVKTTGGYLGLSALSNVGVADQWWYFPALQGGGYFANSVGQTTPIFASRADSAAATDTTGFYLISIDTNTPGEYRAGKGYRSNAISAVVSKYYNAGSFTTGTTADSIPYVHAGPPISMSEFRVRILGPNKQVATDLGNRSSIILQVIKATGRGVPPRTPES